MNEIQSVFEDAKVYSDYKQSEVYELLNKTYQLLKHVLEEVNWHNYFNLGSSSHDFQPWIERSWLVLRFQMINYINQMLHILPRTKGYPILTSLNRYTMIHTKNKVKAKQVKTQFYTHIQIHQWRIHDPTLKSSDLPLSLQTFAIPSSSLFSLPLHHRSPADLFPPALPCTNP